MKRLELEVRFDAQPIEGRLYDRDDDPGRSRPFSGWLGLIAAIQAAGPPGGSADEERRTAS